MWGAASPKRLPKRPNQWHMGLFFGPTRNTKFTARPNRLIETTFINIFATHGEHGRSARINNTQNIGACARTPGRQFARNRGRPDSGPSADRPTAWNPGVGNGPSRPETATGTTAA